MSNKNLFEDESSGDEVNFKTNKDFAKNYNKYRQKELLKQLKDKEQNESDSSSDSDSSEDDEAAFNPQFDEEFFKTLSSLKRKDPTIYEKETKFFENVDAVDGAAENANTKAGKKLTVKQYEHDMLMKTGGQSDDDETTAANERPASPSYNEEQKQIKSEFKRVLDANESDDDDGFGGIFTRREKTQQEQEHDDAEQAKWMEEHSARKEESIKEIWSNRQLSKDEKFLRDYILTNGYADRDDDEIPTYDEIVADDDFEEKQTEFEHKYNFRFEDPDQEFIKRYPRTIDNSVRKVDNRRKEKRVERRDRKEIEKKEKFQEVEMLKELKRRELEERMEQLKAVTGADELNIDDMDLDGDFDPLEYDKKMSKIFDNDYYQIDEGDEKPEAPSDIEDLQVENYDEYDAEKARAADGHCEDDDFNMDCDYDEQTAAQSFQREMIESTHGKRKRRKRKSKFMEMLETKKPTFDGADEKSYSQYLDEYYKLDCEDIIGDVKCRFKYVETVPCDYGLSIEEILLAKNKELNAWASLKKATQIRPDHVERNEQFIYQKKSRNDMLKRKILHSLFEPSDDEEEEEAAEKSQPVKKSAKAPQSTVTTNELATKTNIKKTKKQAKATEGQAAAPASPTNLAADVAQAAMAETKPATRKEVQLDAADSKPPKLPKSTAPPVSEKIKPNKKIQAQKPSGGANKSTAVIRFNAKRQTDKLKKVQQKTIAKQPKNNASTLSDERLRAFGINPKKYNKKQKYGTNAATSTTGNTSAATSNAGNSQRGPQTAKPKPTKNKNLRLKLAKALNA